MKYIVTGATSCIGSAVVEYLLKHGENVVATMRQGSEKAAVFLRQFGQYEDKLQIVCCDFSDIASLGKAVDDADVFLNFAWAGTSKEQRNSPEVQQRNVENALTAMRTAAKIGCKLYVEAGSQAEYGYREGEIKEDALCEPFTEYGKAKLRCWEEGRLLAKTLGVGYAHLRIFSVYGETESNQAILPYCIRQMQNDESIELSPCTQYWNFLYRHDAAEMICRLAKIAPQPPEGGEACCEVYNIASNDTRVLKDFIEEFRDLCDVSPLIVYGKVQPSRLLSIQPSIAKVLSVIGEMQFTPFAEGLKNEIEYIRQL